MTALDIMNDINTTLVDASKSRKECYGGFSLLTPGCANCADADACNGSTLERLQDIENELAIQESAEHIEQTVAATIAEEERQQAADTANSQEGLAVQATIENTIGAGLTPPSMVAEQVAKAFASARRAFITGVVASLVADKPALKSAAASIYEQAHMATFGTASSEGAVNYDLKKIFTLIPGAAMKRGVITW